MPEQPTRKSIIPKTMLVSLSLLYLILTQGCVQLKNTQGASEDHGLFVTKVPGLSKDFIMGVDVSSVLSLEESGVVFKNREGEKEDLFKTLAENGINSVRIRVWNDPYTADGMGYGGGNCDIHRAIGIGRRATDQGLWVFLDFHYSDFWADPKKQMVPKAWKSMGMEEKTEALYQYTKDSLKAALEAGVDIRMVQIGNETTNAFCGETNWINIGALMRAASRAIREIAADKKRDIDIAIHFTNPERAGQYERFVRILQTQKVDYDVFASSWYPYWHGSPENLTATLREVAELSGKRVLCAEFSYAYTYEDGDGFPNTVSRETMLEKPWPFTVQGQASAIRTAIAALAAVGKAGMGVYYWEPAWLPVPGTGTEEQARLWERHGSGWATSFATEYDPVDAGVYYGGTSWDNQALFSFDGRPLASQGVWRLVRTGASTKVKPDAAEESLIRLRIGDKIVLPEEVEVLMNDGSRSTASVHWDAEATSLEGGEKYGERVPIDKLSSSGVGEYSLIGTVEDPVGASPLRASGHIFVLEPNYVDNPSFEEADLSMWNINNIGGVTTELYVQNKSADAKTGEKALHFWSKNKVEFRVEQTVRGLPEGLYKFSMVIHGGDAGNPTMYIFARSGGEELRAETKVDGWRNFRQPVIPDITVQDGTVTIGAYIASDPKGWGSLDDFILTPMERAD